MSTASTMTIQHVKLYGYVKGIVEKMNEQFFLVWFCGRSLLYTEVIVHSYYRTVLSEGRKDYLLKGVCTFGAVFGTALCSVSRCVILIESVIMFHWFYFYRIYLKYHSVSQVLSGVALGCLFGALWFTVIQVKNSLLLYN